MYTYYTPKFFLTFVSIWTVQGQDKFQNWTHANLIMNFQVQ